MAHTKGQVLPVNTEKFNWQRCRGPIYHRRTRYHAVSSWCRSADALCLDPRVLEPTGARWRIRADGI